MHSSWTATPDNPGGLERIACCWRPTRAVQVSILHQLAGLLTRLHDISLPAERFSSLRPSSLRVYPAKCYPSGGAPGDVAVWLAPLPKDNASGSFRRSDMPRCLRDADELCAPDVIDTDRRVCECMRIDAWRLGALGAVLLAVFAYGPEAPERIARAGTASGLLGDVASVMAGQTDLGVLAVVRVCTSEVTRPAVTMRKTVVVTHVDRFGPVGFNTLNGLEPIRSSD